ncbi:MAG TPA: hypothetical protein PK395_09050, partial [bacterium]|nr:hypothetical protein [bacterium]
MKRIHTFIVLFAVMTVGFALSALAAVTAVRVLPGEVYLPSERITIIIEVTGDPGAVLVMETPPAEWKIFASSSGILSSGVITWTLGSFDGAETLRYYVTPPKTATGEAVFSGIVGDRE